VTGVRRLLLMLALAIPVAARAAPAGTAAGTTIPTSLEARAIVAKVFPIGAYRKLMTGTLQQMMGGMTDQMSSVPIREFAKAAGVDAPTLARIDKTTIGEIMVIIDPVYQKRTRLMMDGMFVELTNFMEAKEPTLREGLAEAYTVRFTPVQLREIAAFFDTPTGNAYAAQQMFLMTDPAVMTKMQAMMPEMMRTLPDIMLKAMKATESLPKPKTYGELNVGERDKLARLLGIDPGKMNK
jgi:hypothetical protein